VWPRFGRRSIFPANQDAQMPRHARPLLTALLLLGLSGCSAFESTPQVRGNKVDPDLIGELVVGTSTRQDAQALLGTPSARGTFDDEHWYYIGSITRPRVARTPEVESMQVVALSFDDGGVLREVRTLTEADGRNVGMVARATPVPGNDQTIMQQLLGNVGRFGGLGSERSNTGTSGGGL
jgi:outer membrane protein assembly factor BamE (lipoprotein component of BamABCDE complex)